MNPKEADERKLMDQAILMFKHIVEGGNAHQRLSMQTAMTPGGTPVVVLFSVTTEQSPHYDPDGANSLPMAVFFNQDAAKELAVPPGGPVMVADILAEPGSKRSVEVDVVDVNAVEQSLRNILDRRS